MIVTKAFYKHIEDTNIIICFDGIQHKTNNKCKKYDIIIYVCNILITILYFGFIRSLLLYLK